MKNSPKVKDSIKALKPYIPGKSLSDFNAQSPLIKLSSNENPYGPAVPVSEWKSLVDNVHLYPNYSNHPFTEDGKWYDDDVLVHGTGK